MNNPVAEKKELRKEALYWWISLSSEYKFRIKCRHYPNKETYALNGREIEHIYVNDKTSPYKQDQLRDNLRRLAFKQAKHG